VIDGNRREKTLSLCLALLLLPRFGETDMRQVLASILIAVFSLSVFVSPAAVADTVEADQMMFKYFHLIQDKQYQQALDLVLARAKTDMTGDKWALEILADLFFFPENAAPEMTKLANDWLDKGVREGNADAQYLLGRKYLIEYLKGGKPDAHLAKAIDLLDKAADQKNPHAISALEGFSKKDLESRGAPSRHAGRP